MTVARTPHLRRVGFGVTIASLGVIAFATLLPAPPGPTADHLCVICGSVGTLDAFLNVLLFIPLGVGLSLSGVSAKHALFAMCALSALIETVQAFAIVGRDATLRDVLTNTLGGALGFAIAKFRGVWLTPAPRIAGYLTIGWAAVWITLQAVSSYAFTSALTTSQYYGEIAPTLGNFAVFPGTVLSTSVGGVPLSDRALDESRTLQHRLPDGAAVVATVVPAERTGYVAPIVRIADANKNEIVLVAQDADRLLFGIRTGAAVLRLRPPLFAISDVFPARDPRGSAADTVTVTAYYTAKEVGLQARSDSDNRENRIQLGADLGWTFLLPFRWLIEGTRGERAISWLWLACLALPLGYWSIRVREPGSLTYRIRSTIPLATGALVCIGMIAIPRTFGLSPEAKGDCWATVTGFLVGCALARPEFWMRWRQRPRTAS